MVGGGLVVLAGAGLGTLVSGLYLPTTLGFAAAGVLYALVEALDATAAAASRFLCFTFAIGAHYIHLDGIGAAAALATVAYGFAVSAVWDGLVGGPRPSLAPAPAGIARRLRDTAGERWRFAAAVGIVVPLASLTSVGLGVAKPYWTLIAVVLVLRHDVMTSWRTMVEVMLGCVAGAVAALVVSALVGGGHWGLIAGMMIAALIRWPAHEIHGILGNAALTMFVLLLLEVIAGSAGVAARDVEERVLDFSLGCGFAMLALGLDALFDAVHRRFAASRPLR
nr:FUSC family protein [Ancylobacter lacus]